MFKLCRRTSLHLYKVTRGAWNYLWCTIDLYELGFSNLSVISQQLFTVVIVSSLNCGIDIVVLTIVGLYGPGFFSVFDLFDNPCYVSFTFYFST